MLVPCSNVYNHILSFCLSFSLSLSFALSAYMCLLASPNTDITMICITYTHTLTVSWPHMFVVNLGWSWAKSHGMKVFTQMYAAFSTSWQEWQFNTSSTLSLREVYPGSRDTLGNFVVATIPRGGLWSGNQRYSVVTIHWKIPVVDTRPLQSQSLTSKL